MLWVYGFLGLGPKVLGSRTSPAPCTIHVSNLRGLGFGECLVIIIWGFGGSCSIELSGFSGLSTWSL